MFELKTILKKHLNEITQFITNNIYKARIRKDRRISVNCPYCNDTKSHLYINIDWGNFKCFRCDTTGSIFKIMREYNLYDDFYTLIQSFNNEITIEDAKEELKTKKQNKKTNHINLSQLNQKIIEFQNKYKTKLIKENNEALTYLKSRIKDIDNINIDLFLCDDNYIYIPIINNHLLIMYLGRLYNKNNHKLKRYIVHKFEDDIECIGFLDEFLESNNNKLYICEGYFDSYSVNQAFNSNISICVFGKYSRKIINSLIKYLPNDFSIVLLLDSLEKDSNMKNSIDSFYNILSKQFNNISICSLPYSDCNDIYVNQGKEKLKEIIEKNTMSYLKYKILNI